MTTKSTTVTMKSQSLFPAAPGEVNVLEVQVLLLNVVAYNLVYVVIAAIIRPLPKPQRPT